MTDVREVICRSPYRRTLWIFTVLGAAGAAVTAAAAVYSAERGGLWGVWSGIALLSALVALASLRGAVARVSADAYGLHVRTLPRRRSMPWSGIADLQIRMRNEWNHKAPDTRRVGVVLHDGRRRLLPLPRSWSPEDPEFDAALETLRALHRRHGTPRSDHLPVVSHRSAGYGRLGSLGLCVLLLSGAGLAVWSISGTAAEERAWKSAVPCTARVHEAERGECLSTLPAEIERTEAGRPRNPSHLYFTGGRPLERLRVSQEAAREFRPGDRVELTLWRGGVVEVAGERHVWREHVVTPGSVAVAAALCALAAGWPGARVLLWLRRRRLPDDEVLPSELPFVGALAATALWLLPLAYLHPTGPFDSAAGTVWTVAGSLVTVGLFAWAWHTTRLRAPGEVPGAEEPAGQGAEVFLSARFLEPTDYNPHHFGTHIVIGGGPPAVTPHPGPGRFAAKPIPVERLTVKEVRRVRGGDREAVPGHWHIAELDDAGRPVRLAAAPGDLTRILRELEHARTPASSGEATGGASTAR
ncbi:PH domain-containing protein [Streptomyces chitinivorans]|uniref:PH domain-containing protein n=1 Tax=Streptomyces chitinivorans TaxID=1257027 RepID=A0ABW7HR48_9ACTN|nr:PH domain-containing protein [Streptomyces chitinivorans]MDH2408493.1 PH domain-containing protein [Streptomyces chitinivorans]